MRVRRVDAAKHAEARKGCPVFQEAPAAMTTTMNDILYSRGNRILIFLATAPKRFSAILSYLKAYVVRSSLGLPIPFDLSTGSLPATPSARTHTHFQTQWQRGSMFRTIHKTVDDMARTSLYYRAAECLRLKHRPGMRTALRSSALIGPARRPCL